MTTHIVKSWPQFFEPIVAGIRTSDMRDKTERNYQIGDRMLLQEYDPFKGAYTGREQEVEITHIISNDTPCALSSVALDNNFAVLSIRLVGQRAYKIGRAHDE